MARERGMIGPLRLRPIFQERIWGVENLPEWYPQPAPGKPIGEAWLTAETCVVDSGPLEGTTLAELTRQYPAAFGSSGKDGFPLLIKTLFPREKLSVQVHPDDRQAAELGELRGKTECWYILSADPGAAVAVGFREPLSIAAIQEAIENKTLEAKLAYLPVKAGDMVYVDAGTVHAIGPGMVVLETQQYSDMTYRLYDYGRPRELHIGPGLAVAKVQSDAGLVAPVDMDGFTRLVASPYFVVDRFVAMPAASALAMKDKVQMLFALQEGCVVESAGSAAPLEPGSIFVLPAEGVEYTIRGAGEVIRIAQP